MLSLITAEQMQNVIGYTAWDCIDLIAASTGQMSKRYGFIHMDLDDEEKRTLSDGIKK